MRGWRPLHRRLAVCLGGAVGIWLADAPPRGHHCTLRVTRGGGEAASVASGGPPCCRNFVSGLEETASLRRTAVPYERASLWRRLGRGLPPRSAVRKVRSGVLGFLPLGWHWAICVRASLRQTLGKGLPRPARCNPTVELTVGARTKLLRKVDRHGPGQGSISSETRKDIRIGFRG